MKSSPPRDSRPGAAGGLRLLVVLTLVGVAAGQEPRWTHQAPAAGPWIPASAALAGHDNLALASGNFGHPHLMLVPVDGTDGVPLAEEHGVADASTVLQVAAGSRAGALYAVAQYATDSIFRRRTEVTAYDGAEGSGGLALRFEHDLGLVSNGPALVACDASGRNVVAAAFDDVAGELQVDGLAGSDGALLFRRRFTASSLDALAMSGDGTTIAVRGGGVLHVLDGSGVSLLDAPLGPYSRALGLSHDGTLLAVGAAGEVTVFRARAASPGYDAEAHVTGEPGELPVCVGVSADGSSWAIGWWNSVTGRTARLDWRDGVDHVVLAGLTQTTESLQNLPVDVDLTADGRRVAFGTWGGADASLPRVFLLERGAAEPVAAFALPGSVQALDLDASGTRVLVAAKDAHANQVAGTGALRLFDTGERDLALSGPVRLGGRIDAEFEPPAPGAILFVIGAPLPGAPLDGSVLAVDRTRRLFLFPGLSDPDGIARLSVQVPDSPELSGRNFVLQGVVRGAQSSFSRPIELLILD